MELAKEFPGLSIMVAHHDRKMEAEDVFDTVSGTLGLTGGVDTIAILKRSWRGASLALARLDLTEQVIAIRDTKFFKTRLVPIGPKLGQELVEHIERRRRLPLPRGEESPLFTTRDGRPWHYTRVISWFQDVRRAAGISCPVGEH
jgi:hypothetical protein